MLNCEPATPQPRSTNRVHPNDLSGHRVRPARPRNACPNCSVETLSVASGDRTHAAARSAIQLLNCVRSKYRPVPLRSRLASGVSPIALAQSAWHVRRPGGHHSAGCLSAVSQTRTRSPRPPIQACTPCATLGCPRRGNLLARRLANPSGVGKGAAYGGKGVVGQEHGGAHRATRRERLHRRPAAFVCGETRGAGAGSASPLQRVTVSAAPTTAPWR